MEDLAKAMRAIGKAPYAKAFIEELKEMRDMPLTRDTPEKTYHQIGRRDFALGLLDLINSEETTDE